MPHRPAFEPMRSDGRQASEHVLPWPWAILEALCRKASRNKPAVEENFTQKMNTHYFIEFKDIYVQAMFLLMAAHLFVVPGPVRAYIVD